MKLKKIGVIVTVLMLAMLMMTGCSSSEFGLVVNDDNTAVVTAENAGEDDSSSAGTITVGENQQISVEASEGAEGTLQLDFIAEGELSEDADADELAEALEAAPTLTLVVEGEQSTSGPIPAGDYLIKASSLDKLTGTYTISVTDMK